MDEEIDIYADIPSFNENDSHKVSIVINCI